VVNSFAPYRAIRAWLPLNQVEEVAALPDVVAIRPAIEPIHRKLTTSEGDVAHRANLARSTFGINGSGVSVGVLSDSVDNLAQVQKTGDVGAVTVLPGQSGVPDTGEGTALLEIVYDLAPGAAAFFATTGDSEASMATNIQALRSAGCDILVDDVAFFSEPVFQDGIIAQAIESVAADGAIYVSAAQRPAYLDERAGVDGNARSARYRVAGAGGGTRDRCAQHGGLVARSAHHYGTVAGHRWRRHLRKLVFLGTPHHGAALERGGHRLHRLFDRTPYTAPFARLGKIRSAGITDLRHGSLLDEDWHGRDRFAHGEDARRPVPLPAGVDCFAIGATMGSTPRDLRGRLLGDGIVPLPSALGRHRDPQFTLALPKSHQWIARDMSHFDLLSRPQVYERIHAWLAG